MKIDGPIIALRLSILGLMASLFLTKLGDDVKKIILKISLYHEDSIFAKPLKNIGKQKSFQEVNY